MAGILFPPASVGLIVLPLMLFHQIQLMACAIIAQRYAARPNAFSRRLGARACPTQSLAGRIALVTGASRGIGRASALALALAGAQVIATARTQGALEELDDEIRALEPASARPWSPWT